MNECFYIFYFVRKEKWISYKDEFFSLQLFNWLQLFSSSRLPFVSNYRFGFLHTFPGRNGNQIDWSQRVIWGLRILSLILYCIQIILCVEPSFSTYILGTRKWKSDWPIAEGVFINAGVLYWIILVFKPHYWKIKQIKKYLKVQTSTK